MQANAPTRVPRAKCVTWTARDQAILIALRAAIAEATGRIPSERAAIALALRVALRHPDALAAAEEQPS